MELSFIKRLNWQLTGLVALLMLISLAVQSSNFSTLFRPLVEPELERKAEVVGSYVVAQLDRAVSFGIEVDKLVGVDELLTDTLAANPDVKYLGFEINGRLHAFAGDEAARSGDRLTADGRAADGGEPLFIDTVLPVEGGGAVARLHIGMSAGHVHAALNEIVFDLGSVLIVAILLNVEILLLVVGTSVGAPLRRVSEVILQAGEGDVGTRVNMRSRDEVGGLGRAIDWALDSIHHRAAEAAAETAGAPAGATSATERAGMMQRVVELRFAIFVFAMAEELTRTFLSVYIKSLFEPIPGLAMEMVIGAPIALFMLLWAISQPIAGSLSERRGRRVVFLSGAMMSFLGLLGSGLAGDLIQLAIARCLTAVGYASVFIAAQGFVIDATDPKQRAQAIAIYAGGILSAGVCGPAIGGIVAGQVGFRATFVISAGLVLLAAFMAWRVLPRVREATARSDRGLRLAGGLVCLRNPRFVGLTIFSAVPAKLGLTALLFFLLPLALDDQGISQSWIGRVLLIYWLLMIFVSPMAAKLSDRWGQRTAFLVLGGLLAAAAAYVLSLPGSLAMALAGVALLGVAHALLNAPQLAMLADVCVSERAALGETTVIGMFRLIERLGSVVAPFLAGLFLARYGYAGALEGIGAVLALCVGAQLLLTAAFRPRPPDDLPQRTSA
ncbi:MAG TPA: MFS transporter [Azospirillum sp.]|nr:MFS transporter [Azospirillum sp.]